MCQLDEFLTLGAFGELLDEIPYAGEGRPRRHGIPWNRPYVRTELEPGRLEDATLLRVSEDAYVVATPKQLAADAQHGRHVPAAFEGCDDDVHEAPCHRMTCAVNR
jgi:hypothetical protein